MKGMCTQQIKPVCSVWGREHKKLLVLSETFCPRVHLISIQVLCSVLVYTHQLTAEGLIMDTGVVPVKIRFQHKEIILVQK